MCWGWIEDKEHVRSWVFIVLHHRGSRDSTSSPCRIRARMEYCVWILLLRSSIWSTGNEIYDAHRAETTATRQNASSARRGIDHFNDVPFTYIAINTIELYGYIAMGNGHKVGVANPVLYCTVLSTVRRPPYLSGCEVEVFPIAFCYLCIYVFTFFNITVVYFCDKKRPIRTGQGIEPRQSIQRRYAT